MLSRELVHIFSTFCLPCSADWTAGDNFVFRLDFRFGHLLSRQLSVTMQAPQVMFRTSHSVQAGAKRTELHWKHAMKPM